MVLPIKRKNCCEKKTRVISWRVDWVWHLRSRMVGPRKATQSPKLKNTIQYVKVCCQLLRNKAQMRSLSRCFILEKVSEVFLQHLHSAIHLRDEETCPNWESRVEWTRSDAWPIRERAVHWNRFFWKIQLNRLLSGDVKHFSYVLLQVCYWCFICFCFVWKSKKILRKLWYCGACFRHKLKSTKHIRFPATFESLPIFTHKYLTKYLFIQGANELVQLKRID